MTEKIITKEEHLHYLKLLKEDSSVLQPEIRFALDFAINVLSSTGDIYIKNRNDLLVKYKCLVDKKTSISKEIIKIKAVLDNLDNMILDG